MSEVNYLMPGLGADVMDRSVTKTFIAAGTIALGDWVMFDSSQTGVDKVLYVLEADVVANGNALVVGVALEASTIGKRIKVCVEGYCAVASVTTGIASDLGLVVDATAGRGDVAAATDLVSPCGTTLILAAGNVAAVIVHKR